MYFKRIEMQGFKSFADRTVIEFGSGITAIVGPNGSGKSNISDAIRWVLGEKSPKNLRGGKMDDMIFSGTDRRKPVSFAEVSIVIDNSDGSLSSPYSEVKVTRRLFRSGDSDYLVNGKKARLKDIFLLFADTGIGKEGYSIIGQGKVDAVLSSKSEERRKIFEEASGIASYRIRKHESELDLEKAEQNLVVINGVITELENQISVLKKQAAGAEQFLKLRGELQNIEVGFLVHGVAEAEKKLAEIKEKYDIVSDEIIDNGREVELKRAANERLTRLDERLEEDYKEARDGAQEQNRVAAETDAAIKINLQRIESVKNELVRMEAEKAEKGKLSEINAKKIEELSAEAADIRRELMQLDANLSKEQRRLDIVIGAITGGSQKASDLNRQLIEDRLAIERLKSANAMLEGQNEIHRSRIAEIEKEISSRESELTEAKSSLDGLLAEYDAANDTLKKLENELAAANSAREALEAELEEKTVSLGDVKTEADTYAAQLKLLREMEQNYEGYARSVKEILTLCKENGRFGAGIHGAVAQVIKVSKEDEAAVSIALGNSFQDIITEDEESAKLAIEYLKVNNLGRATFQPLSAVNPRYIDGESAAKLERIPGYVGIAANIVKYQPKYTSVVGSLLGRVAVFETIDNAINAAKKTGYSFICVSRDGDIVRPSGAITGGSPEKNKRGSALSRTREIPEYEKLLSDAEERRAKLTKDIDDIREKVREEKNGISALAAGIKKSEIAVAGLTANLAAKKRVFDEFAEKEKELRGEADRRKGVIAGAEEKIAVQNLEIEGLKNTVAGIQAELEKLGESARELDGEKERRQNTITGLKITRADIVSRQSRIDEDTKRLRDEIESGQEYATAVEIRAKEAQETEVELTGENERLSERLKEALAQREQLEKTCNEIDAKRRDNAAKIRQGFDSINAITAKIGTLREEAGRLESQRMRHEHDVDYQKTRLFDEYELTYTEAFKLTGGKAPEDAQAAKMRISELRAGIKRLGNVNVASIEDLKECTKRYDFLTAQRKDCEDTKAKLTRLIDGLDSVMKKQFLEQFVLIRENFRIVFRELFGGGTADVVLEDEDNCLDCGIDIIAKPPGTKLRNILLLSGGERAFTALALLFGILRMKPTPFCVLDEVESALDDTNVYRFASYTKGLANDTQFILITHRKGTMEAADALYGVTMEEKGVSKVLSVKMGKI